MSSDHSDVLDNYRMVMDDLKTAAEISGRSAASVSLVAVSKTHPAERIRGLLEAGHRLFGENRVQEAEQKWPALKADFPGTELHLIGPLQTNKVRQAVALFDVIETLDRERLAIALLQEKARSGRCPVCYVQVNSGNEPQKAGLPPQDADDFIRRCLTEWQLPVTGVMCIPPADQPPERFFQELAELAARHGLARISMGMSGDYGAAIAAGASHVRVGTALFGRRPPLVRTSSH